MGKKLTISEINNKSHKLYGDKYTIDIEQIYIDMNHNIKIICNKCNNSFERMPSHHFRNSKCPYCESFGNRNIKFVIDKSKEIHGDKYIILEQKFINMHTKINIHCTDCGLNFKQEPHNHINKKQGCPECNRLRMVYKMDEIIEISNKIHGDRYYIDINQDIINRYSNIEIYCKKCEKKFEQQIVVHLMGCGCTNCNNSHGENKTSLLLDEMDIKYIRQKKFINCKKKRCLPFDFYLPDYNICIEYDGIQHFESRSVFGGIDEYIKRKENDEIKNKFCIDNNIKLIRIKYNENIEDKLKEIKKTD